MFEVKEKDLFEKNMNNYELHQVWMKLKWEKEMDECFDELEKQHNEVQENKYY